MGNQLNACCTSDPDGEKQIKFDATPKAMQGQPIAFDDQGMSANNQGFGTGGTRQNSEFKKDRNNVEKAMAD